MIDYIKQHKYIIIAVMVSLSCVVYYYIDPTQYLIMPKCPVKMITTLDCPGCGFQRALHAFLHGRFTEAIHYNLFLVYAIPTTILWFIISTIASHSRRQSVKTKLIHFNRYIIYCYICCYFIWFAIRNIY